jgi:TetR/AcrR family transcriptional regulator
MHGVDRIDDDIRRSYTEQMIAVILGGLMARS